MRAEERRPKIGDSNETETNPKSTDNLIVCGTRVAVFAAAVVMCAAFVIAPVSLDLGSVPMAKNVALAKKGGDKADKADKADKEEAKDASKAAEEAAKSAEDTAKEAARSAEKSAKDAAKSAEKAVKDAVKAMKLTFAGAPEVEREAANVAAKGFKELAKTDSKYAERLAEAMRKYNVAVAKAHEVAGKLAIARAQLDRRQDKAATELDENVNKVAHGFSQVETAVLVQQGWAGPSVTTVGFSNHGQRISTMVAISQALGLDPRIGVLQASFGTPQENGIIALQDDLASAQTSLADLEDALAAGPGLVSAAEADLAAAQAAVATAGVNLATAQEQHIAATSPEEQAAATAAVAEAEAAVAASEEAQATAQAELDATVASMGDFEAQVSDAQVAITAVETEIETTVSQVSESNLTTDLVNDDWAMLSLDVNRDGIVNAEDLDTVAAAEPAPEAPETEVPGQ